MEYLLVVILIACISTSFLCSLTEAAIYSVPYAHVKHLAESGSTSGQILLRLKENISQPISAILILNTISNTGSPALAGAVVSVIFGEQAVVIFAIIMTLALLYFGEIIPKTLGVNYAKQVSYFAARPLALIIVLLYPLIWISRVISVTFEGKDTPSFSEQEVLSMAAIGTEEGTLDQLEGSVIANVIGLNRRLVRDVLTPRVVVFRLDARTKLGDIEKQLMEWNFTRIPIYLESDPDHLLGYVIQRDIYRELLRGHRDRTLLELKREIQTVPELMQVDELLLHMFEHREHICAVVDEHGSLAGIITLEDIIEEVVGREIVDEYDTISDLRTFARLKRVGKSKK